MVITFRVSELQMLLGLANQSRCGRKTELLQRALSLVDRGVSLPIQLKIRELYQRYSQRSSSYTSSSLSNSSSISGNNGVHRGLSELLGQRTSGGSSGNSSSSSSQMLHHPDVRLKHLPFYDVLGEIVKPFTLVPRTSAKQQEMRVNFCLNEQQVQDITLSRVMRGSPDRVDYTVQLQLRFCLCDNSCRQPDCFPSGVGVKVNSMAAQLPNLIPTNKPGAEPKRPNRPVDITMLCRLSVAAANSIVINWMVEQGKRHCAALYLVERLDSNVLLTRLRRFGLSKPEQTKQLIREKLSLDHDSEIATTSLRVSLLCPLGKMRISIPCRANTCNHLQCFDALTFLLMNEKKPSWMCPVCDRPAEYNRLIIDGLFSDVIANAPDATEIELTKDGRWHVTKTEEVDDDTPCHSPNPDNAVEESSGNMDSSVIDLTETDDEGVDLSKPDSRSESTAPSFSSMMSMSSNVSESPRLSNSPVAVYDLSPLNIPVPTPPPPPLPPSPNLEVSTPPPLPPMAHQSYQPFTLSSKLQNSVTGPPPPSLAPPPSQTHSLLGGFPPMSTGLPFPYPGGMYAAPPFDGIMSSEVVDFFSLMNNMPEYSISNPPFMLPDNMFDYLFQQQQSDTNLSKNGRHSPAGSV